MADVDSDRAGSADGQPELVDWDLAVGTACRLLRPGPQLSHGEASEVVRSLRELADEAAEHVSRYTGLVPQAPAPVTVVDRREWVRSNVTSLRSVASPLIGKIASSRPPGRLSLAAGRRITGLQVGTLLAYLSSKVLGQYEVFQAPGANGDGRGRLILVAPNVAETERKLDVPTRDFRLWVCLHEQTHRLQFSAVPWLREHLESEIAKFVEVTDLDPTALARRLKGAVTAVRSGASLIEAIQTPQQREVLDRLQALMTLLEGHADQVMDAVGPQVVPSVKTIRERFEARRDGGSPLDRVIRRLLGLDMKLQQYRKGGAFVRAVVERVGVEGFNEVWTSPETLPTRAEIADPEAWLARVHGDRPAA